MYWDVLGGRDVVWSNSMYCKLMAWQLLSHLSQNKTLHIHLISLSKNRLLCFEYTSCKRTLVYEPTY